MRSLMRAELKSQKKKDQKRKSQKTLRNIQIDGIQAETLEEINSRYNRISGILSKEEVLRNLQLSQDEVLDIKG